MSDLAKHQIAEQWASELDEQLYWMTNDQQKNFISSVVELAVDEWGPVRLAHFFAGDEYFAEELAGAIKLCLEDDAA